MHCEISIRTAKNKKYFLLSYHAYIYTLKSKKFRLTTEALYKQLNYVDHTRRKRQDYANLVYNQPELIPKLLTILFWVDDKTSCKAAWVFEFVCKKKLDLVVLHLDYFTSKINRVHLDSAVRPVAKICEMLVKAYYSSGNQNVKTAVLPIHKERIIEACFDWLINNHKTAPKAYSMNTLYLLGTDYDWVHPELKIIIERDYTLQSSGFKARARQILLKLKE